MITLSRVIKAAKKARDSTSGIVPAQMEAKQIPVNQWQEILDATEILALSYKQQRRQQHMSNGNTKTTSTSPISDDNSVSEDSIYAVKRAINKFKEHARLLGVQERDLMEAVRDDDRSVPSQKQQQRYKFNPKININEGGGGGGVTDKVNCWRLYFENAFRFDRSLFLLFSVLDSISSVY
jgi:hypothetical protein